jgi:hypothetical protein
MLDETIQTLHRRIAQLELALARSERHNAELRSAIEALMAPPPVRLSDSFNDPLPPYGR